MNRSQLEHAIRAAGTIADIDDLVVINSQSILGEFPDAPAPPPRQKSRFGPASGGGAIAYTSCRMCIPLDRPEVFRHNLISDDV